MLSSASVLGSGKEALDVESDDPPDEALSCRRHAWDVPYTVSLSLSLSVWCLSLSVSVCVCD